MACLPGHNIADHIMALSQKITHEDATAKGMYMTLQASGDGSAKKSIEDVGEYSPAPGAGFTLQNKVNNPYPPYTHTHTPP